MGDFISFAPFVGFNHRIVVNKDGVSFTSDGSLDAGKKLATKGDMLPVWPDYENTWGYLSYFFLAELLIFMENYGVFKFNFIPLCFANRLPCGVMVAHRILVPLVWVRILSRQHQ